MKIDLLENLSYGNMMLQLIISLNRKGGYDAEDIIFIARKQMEGIFNTIMERENLAAPWECGGK